MPPEPAPEPVFVEETIALARIEAIVANARATWLVLIGFLAFITVTLFGVSDVDFFSATATTDLPIVNTAIPTTTFFWAAAWLAAVLHTYFHLLLLKLWDALAEAPPKVGEVGAGRLRLGERVRPWLVNDWALRRRPDEATNQRPMDQLADFVTALNVWLATPLVLAGFWWRSMTAHDAWLTLAVGGALLVSIFASFQGRYQAGFRLKAPGLVPQDQHATGRLQLWSARLAASVTVTIVVVSFARTQIDVRFGVDPYYWTSLAPIDLVRAEIAVKPDDWLARDAAERQFRVNWCRDQGLSPDACELPSKPHQFSARRQWCTDRSIADCDYSFHLMDNVLENEWTKQRYEYIDNIGRPDLEGRDLRFADAPSAFIASANLARTRLDRANLAWAELEGAYLVEADLEGASLFMAHLRAAVLRNAKMNGAYMAAAELDLADLSGATLKNANLSAARLHLTNLFRTRLDSADLSAAQLGGADLSEAVLERANLDRADLTGTSLTGANLGKASLVSANLNGALIRGAKARFVDMTNATLDGAALHSTDFRGARGLTQEQLLTAVGDADTILPLDHETGQQLYVLSCWTAIPPAVLTRPNRTVFPKVAGDYLASTLRVLGWLCDEGEAPQPVGRPADSPGDR